MEKLLGNDYTSRNLNRGKRICNVIGKALRSNKIKIDSALEIGCNIGLNLIELKKFIQNQNYMVLDKQKCLRYCEKNSLASTDLYIFQNKKKFDLLISSGVLIHQNPKNLKQFYRKMYNLSKKYLYLDEYFNPRPVMISYRGFKNKLFKRDFAKELWHLYPKLKLIDYGFHWSEDPLKRKL